MLDAAITLAHPPSGAPKTVSSWLQKLGRADVRCCAPAGAAVSKAGNGHNPVASQAKRDRVNTPTATVARLRRRSGVDLDQSRSGFVIRFGAATRAIDFHPQIIKEKP